MQLGVSSPLPKTQTFNVQGICGEYKNLKISLLGKHQLLNAACALGAVELLQSQSSITKGKIRKGLAKTIWPGRLEVLQVRGEKKLSSYQAIKKGRQVRQGSPITGHRLPVTGHRSPITVVLDGAHNVAGVGALTEAIRDSFDYKRLILVLGILKGKDIKGILARLMPLASRIIVTKPQTPRAVEPEEIAGMAKEYPGSIVIKRRVSQAISQALLCAGSKDIILITGSLYTVGEAKTYLEG